MQKASISYNDTSGPRVEHDSNNPTDAKSIDKKYNNLSLKELRKLLDKSVSNEDYEEASHIRDEIQRREGKA